MRWKLLDDRGEKTWAVIFDDGDEAASGLLAFARDQGLGAAHLTAIGGFSDMVLGYYDRTRKEYKRIPIAEQCEVLSLIGDVALKENGEPQVHAHVVVGKADGTTMGGHLLEAHVWPTLEVVIVKSPAFLQRKMDEEAGLPLIRP